MFSMIGSRPLLVRSILKKASNTSLCEISFVYTHVS